MKILILEDNATRIKWFRKKLEPFSELEVFTEACPAINRLKEEKFDIIFLDHDLDGQVYVNSLHENTGYQVAKIIPTTINKDSKIVIHSLNPVGVDNMINTMIGLDVYPIQFGSFDCMIEGNFENRRLVLKETYL